jgi:hypothetical protein
MLSANRILVAVGKSAEDLTPTGLSNMRIQLKRIIRQRFELSFVICRPSLSSSQVIDDASPTSDHAAFPLPTTDRFCGY